MLGLRCKDIEALLVGPGVGSVARQERADAWILRAYPRCYHAENRDRSITRSGNWLLPSRQQRRVLGDLRAIPAKAATALVAAIESRTASVLRRLRAACFVLPA